MYMYSSVLSFHVSLTEKNNRVVGISTLNYTLLFCGPVSTSKATLRKSKQDSKDTSLKVEGLRTRAGKTSIQAAMELKAKRDTLTVSAWLSRAFSSSLMLTIIMVSPEHRCKIKSYLPFVVGCMQYFHSSRKVCLFYKTFTSHYIRSLSSADVCNGVCQ